MVNPYTDLDANVHAQVYIIDAARQFNPKLRIVFSSTRQIYGRPQYLPVDEAHPITPVDVNGINKTNLPKSDHLLDGKVYGLEVTCLRLTNTYGPRMRVKDARQTFLGWWIRQLIEGQELQIFGTGEQRRDLNFVDDVISAMLYAAVNPKAVGQVYNLGGEPISLLELANSWLNVMVPDHLVSCRFRRTARPSTSDITMDLSTRLRRISDGNPRSPYKKVSNVH